VRALMKEQLFTCERPVRKGAVFWPGSVRKGAVPVRKGAVYMF